MNKETPSSFYSSLFSYFGIPLVIRYQHIALPCPQRGIARLDRTSSRNRPSPRASPRGRIMSFPCRNSASMASLILQVVWMAMNRARTLGTHFGNSRLQVELLEDIRELLEEARDYRFRGERRDLDRNPGVFLYDVVSGDTDVQTSPLHHGVRWCQPQLCPRRHRRGHRLHRRLQCRFSPWRLHPGLGAHSTATARAHHRHHPWCPANGCHWA